MGGLKIIGQGLGALAPVSGQRNPLPSQGGPGYVPAPPQRTPPIRINGQTGEHYFGWLDAGGRPEAPPRSGEEARRAAYNRQGTMLGRSQSPQAAADADPTSAPGHSEKASADARDSVRSDRAQYGGPVNSARLSVAAQLGSDDRVPRAEASSSWSPPVSLATTHEEVAARQMAARSVGVDPAKANFWKRFASAAITGIATGLFIAGGVATGGGLFIAGAALLGALTLKLTADTVCAGLLIRNARAAEEGRPPPHSLPLGDDSLGNLLYLAMTSKREREDLAEVAAGESAINQKVADRAAKISVVIMTVLGLSTMVVAGGASSVAGVVAGINAVLIGAATAYTAMHDSRRQQMVGENEAAVEELIDYASRVQERPGPLTLDEQRDLDRLMEQVEYLVDGRATQVEDSTLPVAESKTQGALGAIAPDVGESIATLIAVGGSGLLAESWRAYSAAVAVSALERQQAANQAQMEGLRRRADAVLPPGAGFA